MKILTALDTIRSNPHLFLIPGMKVDEAICLSLVRTAVRDGVDYITVHKDNELFFVGADQNWIARNHPNCTYVFDKLIPLHGEQNTFRAEVLLTAFSESYAVIEDGVCLYNSDGFEASDSLFELARRTGKFCIAFLAQNQMKGANGVTN